MLKKFLDAVTKGSSEGDQGEHVKGLQDVLGKLGFDAGKADGIFGPKTANAVKQFQSKTGLGKDGIVGPKTMSAIKGALTKGDVGQLKDIVSGPKGAAPSMGKGLGKGAAAAAKGAVGKGDVGQIKGVVSGAKGAAPSSGLGLGKGGVAPGAGKGAPKK